MWAAGWAQSLTRSAYSGAAGGVARMPVSVTLGHVVAADCAGAGRRVAVVPGPGGAYDDQGQTDSDHL